MISSVLSAFFTFLLLLANIGSLAFNTYVIIFCPYFHCGYFYNGEIEHKDNQSNHNHSIKTDAATMEKYVNWNKVVISTATFAGFTSYFMIIFMVMLPLYSNLRSCCRSQTDIGKRTKSCSMLVIKVLCYKTWKSFQSNSILSPFCDDNSKLSTALKPLQACYFYFFYSLNLFLYFSNLGVFGYIMSQRVSRTDRTDCDLDESGLIFQFLSQLCAVQSCFVFSKVAYSAVNNFLEILNKFKLIDVDDDTLKQLVNDDDPSINTYLLRPRDSSGGDDDDGEDSIEEEDRIIKDLVELEDTESLNQARLYLLQNIYYLSVSSIRDSLDPYGVWFSVHWVLYTLSAFLSLAFLTDTISLFFYSTDEWYESDKNIWSLTYIFLFTAEHAFLFLYPCFRAAKITSMQWALVSRFATQQWKYIKLPVQTQFLNYLQSQNFGFRISLFCVDVTFGFNLAIVSIFVGTFGVVLKLSL